MDENKRAEEKTAAAVIRDGAYEAALKERYGTVYNMDVTTEPDDETRKQQRWHFKKPLAVSYDRYVKTLSKSPTKATKAFVMDNIVEEEQDEMTACLEKYPAMAIPMSEKLLAMLGMGEVNLTRL